MPITEKRTKECGIEGDKEGEGGREIDAKEAERDEAEAETREREREMRRKDLNLSRGNASFPELTFLRTETAPRIKRGWSAWNPPTIRITLRENAVTRFDLFERLPRAFLRCAT